jgi:DNA-binding transcriptional LysR family regulator
MPLPQPVPDLVSLELLRSVAELGSIRRAAEAHRVSQPAASMRLRSLERAVGLPLIDRSGGTARLTPEGRAVVEWSEPVIEGMEALMAGTSAMRTREDSQLRLAASMTVAEYLLPSWLNQMHKAHPEVRVSLAMGNSERVLELVSSRGVDLGFVEGRSVPSGVRTRAVVVDELVAVVAKHHPWARRHRPVNPGELARTPLIVREVGSGTREVLESALHDVGLAVTATAELASTTAIKAAVQAGAAPAVLGKLAIHQDVEEGRLAVVATEGLSLERCIRAVWPRGRRLPAPAKAFLALAGEADRGLRGAGDDRRTPC